MRHTKPSIQELAIRAEQSERAARARARGGAHGQVRHRSEADEIGARELILYAHNDRRFSFGSPEGRGKSVRLNLLRKLKSGKYNPELAWKAWLYVIDDAARAYNREFGTGAGFGSFSLATREHAAREYAKQFEAEAPYYKD